MHPLVDVFPPLAVVPSGRPPAAPSQRIQVILPVELVGRLRGVAISRGIGLSTLVRMILHASLEQ